MKIIGLCICYDTYNYGSSLQCYATIKELERLGYKYEIIVYEKSKNVIFLAKQSFRLFNKLSRKEKIRKLKYKMALKRNNQFADNIKIRNDAFAHFISENYRFYSECAYGYKNLKKLAKKYAAVMVGSDQLWLPSGLASRFYNLLFVPDEIPKISYATSFGVSKIPFYQKKRTQEYLNRFYRISVRENSGKNIVETLSRKNAAVVSDPTMLFTKGEWCQLLHLDEEQDNEPYIFCYFLGKNVEHRQKVLELKEKLNGIKIIALTHIDEYVEADDDYADETPFNVGPGEFVNLIKNAKYICTDSFHATVFSILFEKQFLTYERYKADSNSSTNTRIYNLLEILGLQDRIYTNNVMSILNPICFDEVNKKLNNFRNESLEFLQSTLKDAIKEERSL